VGQNEFSEVKLSLGDGVVIERKARKQRQLPFDADPNADKDEEHSEPDATIGQPSLTGAAQNAEQSTSGDDIKDFADGAARAVGARKKRGSNVIDGRSERVKHQDRLQGRDDAH
jgi:hypothetical protein